MKEIEYVPEVCKEENADITGSVVLILPTAAQRMRYLSQCGFVSVKEIESARFEEFETLAKMVEISERHYKEVKLKKKSGVEIKSLEDLMTDVDCLKILSEVASKIIGGFQLGNV